MMQLAALRTRLDLPDELEPLPAPLPMWRATVSRSQWEAAAQSVLAAGCRLISLWGSDRGPSNGGLTVSAAYALPDGLLWVQLAVLPEQPSYPDLSALFPAAARMQRATFDLLGLRAADAADYRPWLRHSGWPASFFPLRRDSGVLAQDWSGLTGEEPYAFVTVQGDGVHEIPVGPVHAGTIEPGHFRFSVVGEKVLRLEQRLGYTHKGIEKRFESMPLLEGYRLAGRVSGDATVAFAWAYCMALESIAGCEVPPRAAWLRALMLERERVANHLGDLGALGNDAALSFGLAQFSRVRENWLRLNHELFGHRLLMDCIAPGGVAADPAGSAADRLRLQCEQVEREVKILRNIYDEHAGLQDRFINTGCVTPQLAARLGLCGLAGRASGIARDLRTDYEQAPYRQLNARSMSQRAGDVAARVAVRFDELFESLRLIGEMATGLPGGAFRAQLGPAPARGMGAGWAESWRGEVLVAIELDEAGGLRRCHCHDPSWQNWPLLEHAIIGNIVPDFPLINKSFNLSYSGHDL